MEKVVGRTDDMLIVRGVNVYPSQIESVLLEFEHAEPHYQLVLRREGTRDTLEAQVEVSEELFSDRMRDLREMEARIAARLKSVLGITVRLRLVEPKTLARSEGKAKRVVDLRGESET
jgi:phenylacetate-CoA ligase